MKRALIFGLFLGLLSCDSEDDGDGNGNVVTTDQQVGFDRGAMLENWADNIILPAYSAYATSLESLSNGVDTFVSSPSETNLASVRSLWQASYLAWQHVEMFEIGPAETIGFQGYTNAYPVDTAQLNSIVASGEYNLELPSRRSQQGLSAIDYLINGLESGDADIVGVYQSNENYGTYLKDVASRLVTLTETVTSGWESSYRDEFVTNTATTATGSINKMVNDYVFYYEKHLRAGKIGIPAGVFSGTAGADKVEAFYQGDFSKALFNEGLDATQNFFNGVSFGSSDEGEGLSSYLQSLSTSDSLDLSGSINDQFEAARVSAGELSDSFADQVESDNIKMLSTYDELQKNVVLLKTDMLSALNIRVDYVDADGD